MQFLFFCLFALGIVALDQWTKYLTVTNIAPINTTVERLAVIKDAFKLTDAQITAMPNQIEAVPGIFHFTHVHNTGAAFSSFEGMRWLFVVIFVVLTAAVVYEYFKKPMPFSKFERWCIAAVYGGGLGNMIDRVRLGYVVDMIEVDFMKFAVFNVADCFIVCGAIALLISLIFFNKQFWKEEKK